MSSYKIAFRIIVRIGEIGFSTNAVKTAAETEYEIKVRHTGTICQREKWHDNRQEERD